MISLQRRRAPSGGTMGKSLGETTVWIRKSGGAPTMMWTSDALAATAFRRMSFKRLMSGFLSRGHPRQTSRGSLSRVLGDADDFVDRRLAGLHLLESVLPQGYQPALPAELAEVGHVGVAGHEVLQAVIHDQQLENAQPARIAGLAALVAALAPEALFGSVALHRKEVLHLVRRGELLLAVLAYFSDQALRQDGVQGGGDEVGLDADVDQSRHRRRRVVGVQGAEHQV